MGKKKRMARDTDNKGKKMAEDSDNKGKKVAPDSDDKGKKKMAEDSDNKGTPSPVLSLAIQYLCSVEEKFMPDPSYLNNAMAKTLRPLALKAIEAYYQCDDFDAFIPYLAMNYFDRFISRHQIPRFHDDERKDHDLFVKCCLVLAWKTTTKSFTLPQFLAQLQIGYEATDILNMEALIIRKLEVLIRPLTPFTFADYYIPFLNTPGDQLRFIRNFVYQIIVTSQADMRITTLRPSLFAANVVYSVSSKLLPKQYSSRLKEALSQFEHIRKMLLHVCNTKVESSKSSSAKKETKAETTSLGVGGTGQIARASSSSLKKPVLPGATIDRMSKPDQRGGAQSAKKETKAETSSLGVGGTGQVAGASSSSLKKPVLPGATIDRKSKPDQRGGGQLGSAARKETKGGAYGSGIRGAGKVARGSSPSLRELEEGAPESTPKKSISMTLLEATLPPGGTVDDKVVGKQSLKKTKPEGTADDKAVGKKLVEVKQEDPTPGEKVNDWRPMEETQQDLTAGEKVKEKRQMEEKLQVEIPALAPISASTEYMRLDFELGWSEYDDDDDDDEMSISATSCTICGTSNPC